MAIVLDQVRAEMARDLSVHQELLEKYVALGRALERQEIVRDVFKDIGALLKTVQTAQATVEEEEKIRLAEIEALAADGPVKAEMIRKFRDLIADIDQKHSVILRDQRDAGMLQIQQNYTT